MLSPFDHGMLNWGGPTQVREERGVDIEAAIVRMAENARRNQEAKRHGNDEVYRGRGRPAGEGVDSRGREAELVGRHLLDGNCLGSTGASGEREQAHVPGRNVFSPRPVGLAGRWSTWMLSISRGTPCWTCTRARSDAMLKASEPQNRMRSGRASAAGVVAAV